MRFLRGIYGLMLSLYPRAYLGEYRNELQMVFNLSLDDAYSIGGLELALMIFREFSSLPKAILYAHLRERRKTKMIQKLSSRFDFEPGSHNEVFAALAPFLLGGAVPALVSLIGRSMDIPVWMQILFTLLMWFFVGGLLVLGFKQGAPRWFMPYLGLPLPIISLLAFNTLVNPEWRGFPFLYASSWFVKQFAFHGVFWAVGLFLSILLIFLLTRFIPRLRPFHKRLQADWTLLSFLLYGAAPFVIVLSFEEFKREEPYLLLSFLTLALFGWLYLRSTTPWLKFWSLLGGLTLAMSVAVLGQTLLYESSFPFTTYARWTTTLSTVIMWMWMVLFMFASAALNLFPPNEGRSRAV